MPCALEYEGRDYWTSRELIEHFLRRGAELGASRFDASHPALAWLNANKDAVAENAALAIRLPVPADRADLADLADLLDAVGVEGLKADAFDSSGAAWVRKDLAALILALRGRSIAPAAAEEAGAAVPASKSPKLAALYGAGSIVFSLILYFQGLDGPAQLVLGLGIAAFFRAFWLSWGLDPDDGKDLDA